MPDTPEDIALPDIEWCVEIPPGEYELGADERSSALAKQTFTLRQPFKLAKYPINQAQFHLFMQDTSTAKGTAWYLVPCTNPDHPRGKVWWSDPFAYARWLTAHYRAAGRLDENWMIDVPSEAEWEIAARYPDGKDHRPSRAQFEAAQTNPLVIINPNTGMHIGLQGFFREWCLQLRWHDRTGLAAEVDAILQDPGSWLRMMDYVVLRGIGATFRTEMAPTWDDDIGFRVVCRPAITS